MSLNKIQIVKSISQDFNGFNSLCYVWGKDTHDNVLVGKEEKKPGKTWTSRSRSHFPGEQLAFKHGLYVGDFCT